MAEPKIKTNCLASYISCSYNVRLLVGGKGKEQNKKSFITIKIIWGLISQSMFPKGSHNKRQYGILGSDTQKCRLPVASQQSLWILQLPSTSNCSRAIVFQSGYCFGSYVFSFHSCWAAESINHRTLSFLDSEVWNAFTWAWTVEICRTK